MNSSFGIASSVLMLDIIPYLSAEWKGGDDRTNLAEHSSAINTRGNAAADLRQVRGEFFAGARRIFSR